MDVRSKVVIVTGAARGIGQEFSRSLAAAGAFIVAADINDCSTTLDFVKTAGAAGIGVRLDVRDASSAHEMVATAAREFGRVER